MTKNSDSAGQKLTNEIRKMDQIGPRTRWNKKHTTRMITRDAILSDIRGAIGEYRGVESAERTAIFDTAHTALNAYHKFVANYRIDGSLRFLIMDMRPWEFTAFLGQMVDSGCTNMGEFEVWFQKLAVGMRVSA